MYLHINILGYNALIVLQNTLLLLRLDTCNFRDGFGGMGRFKD